MRPPMTPEEIAKLPYRPCVGVMLVNDRNEVFAGHRIDSEAPAWQRPQGGIDPGAEPRDAALRELWEQTRVPPALVTVEAGSTEWVAYDLPPDIVPPIGKG